jgi:YggT family protein
VIRVVLCYLIQAYIFVLFVHVIFSWVPRPPEPIMPIVRGVRALVEPLTAPLRRIIPPLQMGGVGLDLSILLLFFAAWLLSAAICR